MKLISKPTREAAWLDAVEHLLGTPKNTEYNLVIEIEAPNKSDEHSKYIRKTMDDLLTNVIVQQSQKAAAVYPVNTVAETIFPAHLYKKLQSIEQVQGEYLNNILNKIKPCRGNNKGTYAQRIFMGYDPSGEQISPLLQVITRLKTQLAKHGGNRCCFDLSMATFEDEEDLGIPINRNDNVIRGFPCLSHLSFKIDLKREKLLLTAIYRSQEMIYKGLGNLLGLARLQDAVAREVGLEVGSFVCHATYATLNKPTGLHVKHLKNLINQAKQYEG